MTWLIRFIVGDSTTDLVQDPREHIVLIAFISCGIVKVEGSQSGEIVLSKDTRRDIGMIGHFFRISKSDQ